MHTALLVSTAAAALVCLMLAPAGCSPSPAAKPKESKMTAESVWWDGGLGEATVPLLDRRRVPLSFVYGGRSSQELLPTWSQSVQPGDKGRPARVLWEDPATKLRLIAEVKHYDGFAAADWTLYFENGSQADAPVLEQVRAMDLSLSTPADTAVTLHGLHGDDCSRRTFEPFDDPLAPGQSRAFEPSIGRSSSTCFPFWNIETSGGGLIAAVGWTGVWSATITRDEAGPCRVQAGQKTTRLVLRPGERIRTPRILVLGYRGGRIDAQNEFRRLLLAHFVPRDKAGKPWQPAFAVQYFNSNAAGARPEWNTQAGQLKAIEVNKALGCDTLWMDAGWFEGGFPKGVGNWTVRPGPYPKGLAPVGQACREAGMKFLVWWEPERAGVGTRLYREHPEFLLGGDGQDKLLNLGQPDARRYITDFLSRQIAEFGVTTYRNDFNMIDPATYWAAADAPDRQGMTEIRYVEGFYAMWDELRARHGDILMDDCAAGGRRIDIEMLSRAIIQTRSDTACTTGRADWDQCQSFGLAQWVPVHATIGWEWSTYAVRSTATGGYCGEWDLLAPEFPLEQARAALAEVNENRKYWYGDFYPLTPYSRTDDTWMAYQLHLRDRSEGIVLAFRRARCAAATLRVTLGGLTAGNYHVTLIDEDRRSREIDMTAEQLRSLDLQADRPASSILVRYRKSK